jgi:hypothetical protein
MDDTDLNGVIDYCREFLLRESADGSDAGLCVAAWSQVSSFVVAFGNRAKREVLNQTIAKGIAQQSGIFLEGFTGDHGGIIGSLAAVGLRVGGNDGRVLWIKGLRELEGVFATEELYRAVPIDEIRSMAGSSIGTEATIDIGPWPRPIMRDGKTVFLVEEVEGEPGKWRIAPKEIIKRYSDQ